MCLKMGRLFLSLTTVMINKCMDKDNIDIIDKFFAEHPSQLKPMCIKSSQLSKNNPDRSTALSRKRRIDNTEPTQSHYRSRKSDPLLDHSNLIKSERRTKKVELIPRNVAQEEYVDQLNDISKRVVFAIGPAGTGKTLLAVLRSVQALRNGEIDKVIITRPAVSVDEKHGFLPGDLNEKMAPWVLPIFDVFDECYGKEITAQMLLDGIIEIAPLGFMRGRTFKRAYVILDEAQNTTPDQMKMLLTRIGEYSRVFVTGDMKQHDRGFDKNGLKDFMDKLSVVKSNTICICKFNREHIERDPVVGEILSIYGDED